MWKFCLIALSLAIICKSQNIIDALPPQQEDEGGLKCERTPYIYRVTQTDENGKTCWDTIKVLACRGRCDSNEISDWRFPFKKSTHPVCVHSGRNRAVATLRYCEKGALPTASRYEYLEAASCRCQLCSSSDTSCEGLPYRPQRSHPGYFGFIAQ